MWSRRHRPPLCSEQEGSVTRPRRRHGTLGDPPPRSSAPELQIFKLCRLAIIPRSQLLQAVGAQCSLGPRPTSGNLPAALSPAPADLSPQTSTSQDHT